MNVIRLASELSTGPFGQAVRLPADRRVICEGNIAFNSSRMSLELCKLTLPENKFNRWTTNVFAVHIPCSLGACGAFFGPVVSTVDKSGTDFTD